MQAKISLQFQTMYAELAQRTLDAAFASDLSPEGRVEGRMTKGRKYWYYVRADEGGRKQLYLGPDADEEVAKRVADFQRLKTDRRDRRRLVATLVREAHLPRPIAKTGEVVEALAAGGFFRLRGVLVGTVAFQCYPGIIGERLPNAVMQTGDADMAQFHSISAAVEDSIPPVLDVLHAVDPSFREIPHQADPRRSTAFAAEDGFKVEFLTPNRGSDDYEGRPSPMPALGGAAAEPLRFLDFLIYQPVRAVMLHGAGVAVNVPAPERYAIHKLIVATRRRSDDAASNAKSAKDVQQAVALIGAIARNGLGETVADAFVEAFERGPSWREALAAGLARADRQDGPATRNAIAEGLRRTGEDPASYGL